MKFDNIKYGLLISVTTMFGGSSLKLYAQNTDGNKAKTELSGDYKKQFMESIAPNHKDVNVEFVVDSVKNLTSNADLIADMNVIQMLAYLDQDSDEYQSYMASRHIVAHELWHRIAMMNEVLEQPMSATQYRTGRDNFEITANFVQLLTFREDYKQATPEERKALRKLKDPKIRMYIQAVEQKIINPLSDDKKDFDFEMRFIARTVASFWHNNMAISYAPRHNAMTEAAGRKEFQSPSYEKNFIRDIKKMNTIGGIDFSQFYDVKELHCRKEFATGSALDTTVFKTPLSAPDYETWIDKRSQLKRFSRQQIQVPNFAGKRLAEERERRPHDERAQPYQILPAATGSKVYFGLKTPLYAAIALKKGKETYKIYPHGAIDKIGTSDSAGIAKVTTLNYDGSYETGQLKNGRREGEYVYYDAKKKEIARCTFANGRARNGVVVFAADDTYIFYHYQNGKMTGTEAVRPNGEKIAVPGNKKTSDSAMVLPARDSFNRDTYLLYKDGKPLAQLLFNDKSQLIERQETTGGTIKIERFYGNGAIKYAALADIKTAQRPAASSPKDGERQMHEALFALEGQPVMTAAYNGTKRSFKLKTQDFLTLLKENGISATLQKTFRQALATMSGRKEAEAIRTDTPKAAKAITPPARLTPANRINPMNRITPTNRVVPANRKQLATASNTVKNKIKLSTIRQQNNENC